MHSLLQYYMQSGGGAEGLLKYPRDKVLFIYGIYIVPLQGNYSEALPAQAQAKRKFLLSFMMLLSEFPCWEVETVVQVYHALWAFSIVLRTKSNICKDLLHPFYLCHCSSVMHLHGSNSTRDCDKQLDWYLFESNLTLLPRVHPKTKPNSIKQ